MLLCLDGVSFLQMELNNCISDFHVFFFGSIKQIICNRNIYMYVDRQYKTWFTRYAETNRIYDAAEAEARTTGASFQISLRYATFAEHRS